LSNRIENEVKLVTLNDVPVLMAENINNSGGAECFFSTRLGGVSSGSYGAMNLNLFKTNDNVPNARKNFNIFCNAVSISIDSLVAGREKHTNNIAIVDKSSLLSDFFDRDKYQDHIDGIITQDSDITLFAYGSDCMLFMFFDPSKRVVAAVHAGWKGSLNGIVPKAVKIMVDEFQCSPTDILVALSPSIGHCCFEVDEPVKLLFEDYDGSFSKHISYRQEKNKYHIDLLRINLELLKKSGISQNNIAYSSYCTMCDDDLFHSYRRDKGDNGVNGAFIKLLR